MSQKFKIILAPVFFVAVFLVITAGVIFYFHSPAQAARSYFNLTVSDISFSEVFNDITHVHYKVVVQNTNQYLDKSTAEIVSFELYNRSSGIITQSLCAISIPALNRGESRSLECLGAYPLDITNDSLRVTVSNNSGWDMNTTDNSVESPMVVHIGATFTKVPLYYNRLDPTKPAQIFEINLKNTSIPLKENIVGGVRFFHYGAYQCTNDIIYSQVNSPSGQTISCTIVPKISTVPNSYDAMVDFSDLRVAITDFIYQKTIYVGAPDLTFDGNINCERTNIIPGDLVLCSVSIKNYGTLQKDIYRGDPPPPVIGNTINRGIVFYANFFNDLGVQIGQVDKEFYASDLLSTDLLNFNTRDGRVEKNFTVPGSILQGQGEVKTMKIKAKLDVSNQIPESNESNTSNEITISFEPPDAQIKINCPVSQCLLNLKLPAQKTIISNLFVPEVTLVDGGAVGDLFRGVEVNKRSLAVFLNTQQICETQGYPINLSNCNLDISTSGAYALKFIFNPDNNLRENNSANNEKTINITSVVPDFSFSTISCPTNKVNLDTPFTCKIIAKLNNPINEWAAFKNLKPKVTFSILGNTAQKDFCTNNVANFTSGATNEVVCTELKIESSNSGNTAPINFNINPNQEITESNITNNTATKNISFNRPAIADLTIVMPPDGDGLVCSLTTGCSVKIKNQGTITTVAGTNISTKLYYKNAEDKWEVLNEQFSSPLGAGGTSPFIKFGNFKFDTVGTYTLRACVNDPKDIKIPEPIGDNNNCSNEVNITIKDPAIAPDLKITKDLTCPASSYKTTDQITGCSVEVTNVGLAPIDSSPIPQTELYDVTGLDWIRLGNRIEHSPDHLGVGGVETINFDSFSFTTPGTHNIIACTDDDPKEIDEIDENNNCSSKISLVVNWVGPNLTVNGNLACPSGAYKAGDSMAGCNITIVNKNSSSAAPTPINTPIQTDLHYSIDDSLWQKALLTDPYNSTLGIGESKTISFGAFNLSSSGNYKFRACVDLDSNIIKETNEDDNCSDPIEFQVASTKPDLTLVENTDLTCSSPGPFNVGESITGCSVSIKNAGLTSTVKTPTTYLLNAMKYPAVPLKQKTSVVLDAGAFEKIYFESFSFSSSGTYTIRACVDHYNDITEGSEGNNCSSDINLEIKGMVNLFDCSAVYGSDYSCSTYDDWQRDCITHGNTGEEKVLSTPCNTAGVMACYSCKMKSGADNLLTITNSFISNKTKYRTSEPVVIKITANDLDGVVKICPESEDVGNGQCFTCSGDPTTCEHEFSVSNRLVGVKSYSFIVTSKNSLGVNGESTKTHNVSVQFISDSTDFTINLVKGWNLISSPTQEDLLFDVIEQQCQTNSEAKGFVKYSGFTERIGYFSAVSPYEGAYVYIDGDKNGNLSCIVSFSGTTFDFSNYIKAMRMGWNLISLPGPIANFNNSINSKCVISNEPIWTSKVSGYWVKVDSNCILSKAVQ